MKENVTRSRSCADKWKAYTGMAAAFLAMDRDADAQVVYTDVDPDEVLFNSDYAIDFDNDGTPDIQFVHIESNISSSSYNLTIRGALAAGDVIGPGSSSYVYGSALAAGMLIAPGDPNWNANSSVILGLRFASSSSQGTYGNFSGQTAYLGCRFVNTGGDTLYAWVHLAVDAQVGNMTILGYAYETTANTAIVAGDQGTTTGVNLPRALTEIKLYPNPTRDLATLRLGDDLTGQVSVQVLDGIGRQVQRAELNMASGTRSFQVDLSALPAGTYFVTVRNGGNVAHRKLVKTN